MRHARVAWATLVFCGLWALPAPASAQSRPTGHLSLLMDYQPNRHGTTELRSRLFAEQRLVPSAPIRITLSGFVEGLLAQRLDAPDPTRGASVENRRVTDAIVRAHEANLELRAGRLDVLAGLARVVWGRLDEIQPTDVINPLDVSRFFFEGRSEARLPVMLGRARFFFADEVSLEGVIVPVFRRGRFDQLDEATSPFNIASAGSQLVVCMPNGCSTLPVAVEERRPEGAQGGARFSATTGRIDWSISAYRGFEPFGLYEFGSSGSLPGELVRPFLAQTFPRFTMIGADFEAVRGEWGLRGEAAVFARDTFQSPALRPVSGRSLDVGAGVDRRAGAYRVSAAIVWHAEQYEEAIGGGRRRNDVSLILSADRTFARERYRLRAFGVYNGSEGSAFARAIAAATLRDNITIEGSGGWFIGDGRVLTGRFTDNDFLYARVTYHF